MDQQWMRQCSLEKPIKDGTKHQVSWIPEQFAVANKWLELLEDGQWENGWRVTSVGSRMPAKECHERGHDHTRQRSASDV